MTSPKTLLREEIKHLLKNVSRGQFRTGGINAAALFRSRPEWTRFGTVFLFISTDSEIDTLPLIQTALEDGKKIFAPRIEAAENSVKRLVFYRVLSAEGPWAKGPFGIREPAAGGTAADGKDFPALVITPGLAFDREGMRLGRGGGFYDRFFAEIDKKERRYTAVGLCMDFQLVERVPAEGWDKKMDGILTGKEFRGPL